MRNQLKGKTVWVSRPEHSAKATAKLFENKGADTIIAPLIQLKLKEDLSLLHSELDKLDAYDWIVFTSENAVKFFFEAANDYGIKFYFYPNLKIATVGEATKMALEQLGFRTNFVPIEYTAEVLAANMDEDIAKKKILIPRSAVAVDEYLRLFEKRGALPKAISIYENYHVEYSSENLLLYWRNADYLTFTSASAVSSFVKQVEIEKLEGETKIICIGPSTAEKVKEVGLEVTAIAEPHTAEGILNTILELEKYVTT